MSPWELDLDGKVVVVTGGSRGIGRATAEAFVRVGATVRIVARNADQLAETAGALGPHCSWMPVDVADEEAVQMAVASTIEDLGSLDVLVNNAAMAPPAGPLFELSASRAAKAALINQWAPVAWARAAWDGWQEAHGGTIVNVASVGGLVAWPGAGYYGATKAALLYLTRQMAVELHPKVRVNAVAPGPVDTGFSRAILGGGGRSATGRVGTPEEVADLVVFLASARASLVNGTTLLAADPTLFAV